MPGKNERLYLLGAAVWASYIEGRKPVLYDFKGCDGVIYVFCERKTNILIGKTIHQLTNYPGFRPFCINMKMFDPTKLVTFEGVENAPNARS